MSSKQQNDQNLYSALSMFNSQVVCTLVSENRQQSTPVKPPSNIHDNGADRRSSAPSASKQVGSNRYVSTICCLFITIKYFYFYRFFIQTKK